MAPPAGSTLARCLALCAVAVHTHAAVQDGQALYGEPEYHGGPGYPFEPMMDEDYIHDSSNPLDRFVWDETDMGVGPSPIEKLAEVKTAGCHTAAPRRASWFSGTAQAGTPCVFGVDVRDENGHCISDDPSAYGPLGWCWTKGDQTEWGSCSDDCPLYGGAKIIQQKIRGTQGKLRQAVETTALLKKMVAERTGKATPPAPQLLFTGAQADQTTPAEEALAAENAALRQEIAQLTHATVAADAVQPGAPQPSRGLKGLPPLTLSEQRSQTHPAGGRHRLISGLLRRFAAQRAQR